jgi:hypothetical protein
MPHKRRTKVRRWVYSHLPKWLRNRDFEVFAAVLCLFGGLPLLFGQVDPPSIEAQLNNLIVHIWGGSLVFGAILVIVGIVKSSTKTLSPAFLTWLRVEAYGLTILAYTAYLYTLILVTYNWQTTLLSATITLIFALTCHSREVAVQLDVLEYRTSLGLINVRD